MIRIEIKDDNIKATLLALHSRMSNLSPLMATLSDDLMRSVQKNFAEEGRPKWDALKPSTLADRAKKGYTGLMLQRKRGLLSSIQAQSGRNYAAVTTNKRYAAVQQFGFKGSVAVKAHTRRIFTTKGKSGKVLKRKKLIGTANVKAFSRKMDITARPFFKLTEEDIQTILESIAKYGAL
ncbi:MAG: phage virion morphogenesis protein [Nitrospirae bacterium]|nr:phage virion morphogenesis protein [Nitrospirota bacterium]